MRMKWLRRRICCLAKLAKGCPVVLVRGLNFPPQDGHASDFNRPLETDLYR